MKAFHEVRNYTSDFMVWHKQYENISFIAHWHREIELIYVRKGSLKMQVTNHAFTANAGDLVICDTGEIHYSNSYSKGTVMDFIIFDRKKFLFTLKTTQKMNKSTYLKNIKTVKMTIKSN